MYGRRDACMTRSEFLRKHVRVVAIVVFEYKLGRDLNSVAMAPTLRRESRCYSFSAELMTASNRMMATRRQHPSP